MGSQTALASTRTKLFSFSLFALAVLQLKKPDASFTGNLLRNKQPIVEIKKSANDPVVSIVEIKMKSKSSPSSNEKAKRNKKVHVSKKNELHTHDVNVTQLDLFRPEDLDGTKPAPCGWHKCFFHSKSSDQIGYLVARSTGKSNSAKRKRLESLDSAWQLAKHLEQEYNIHHFLIAPPINVTVSKSLASRLNQNLKSETARQRFKKRRFPKGSTAFVEKVKPAPNHTLLIGCKDSKLNLFKKVVDKFVLRVKDKESFIRNFKESFANLREILHKEPCLLYDFQVVIDTSGNLYHLDFDRCFSMRTAKKKHGPKRVGESSCFQSLDKIERRVYQSLEKLTASQS